MDPQKISISRDVRAMLIPSGLDVLLAAGNEVKITHHLGGYYTLVGTFGMARIAEADADALGLGSKPEPAKDSVCAEQKAAAKNYVFGDAPAAAQIDMDELWNVAKTVYDPEIPVNIVDLGLVYRMEAKDGGVVEVDMTLTAPGCSMGPMIADDLRGRLEALPSVRQACVNIVWDPPWNRDMMSQEALMILGMV